MTIMALTPDKLIDTPTRLKDLAHLPGLAKRSTIYEAKADVAAYMLANGCSMLGTAAKIGVDRQTIERWLEIPQFLSLVETKKEELRLELLEQIKKAGKQANLWAANAWILDRSPQFGGAYSGGKQTIDITVNVFRHISAEDLGAVIDLSQDDIKLLEHDADLHQEGEGQGPGGPACDDGL